MNSREKLNGQSPEVFTTTLSLLFVLISLTICSNLFGWKIIELRLPVAFAQHHFICEAV